MSPRLKKARKILNPPTIKGLKPYGLEAGKKGLSPLNLLYEEYEAIRLSDYDGLNHHQASIMMDVSRPTFTRIYASALQKIAIAFVEGRQIAIEGGKVYFDSDWYRCSNCKCFFNHPEKEMELSGCPLCGHETVWRYDQDDPHIGEYFESNMCICSNCHYEQKHQPGHPCNEQLCPRCNGLMKRKGTPGCI